MWALTVKSVKKNLYSSLDCKPQETKNKNRPQLNGRSNPIPKIVVREKIDGSRKNYHHNDGDSDHNHHDRDDDMTQDIVLQLVDRTTGCSKIKLERRKQKGGSSYAGETHSGICGSFLLTLNPKEVENDKRYN